MNTELFDKGRDAFRAKDYKAAERTFKEVMKSLDEHHVYYNRVASHLGLTGTDIGSQWIAVMP